MTATTPARPPCAAGEVLTGDALEILAGWPDACVDAVVTDPPYGLTEAGAGHAAGGFMGLAWDRAVPSAALWGQVLRVLKQGGHLLAFFGTRTYHRGVVAVEDGGFEVRDQLGWVYGSGWPKSLDVSKAVDAHVATGKSGSRAIKAVNESRPGPAHVRPHAQRNGIVGTGDAGPSVKRDEPATPEAAAWRGWGTALKPAWEPIVLARKPLAGTVAANVLEHGTGALNVDATRVPCAGPRPNIESVPKAGSFKGVFREGARAAGTTTEGRWPANLVHDGSEEVLAAFAAFGESVSKRSQRGVGLTGSTVYGAGRPDFDTVRGHADAGSAARFFYCAKASRRERGPGNNHPTVKPLALMRWLVRLVTPPGGFVLDPFCGSGSTLLAARCEGFCAAGIDLDPDYAACARARLAAAPESEVAREPTE